MNSRVSGKRKREMILVVEDDASLRNGLALNLRLHGYDVETAADGNEGMRMAFDARPDLVILDIMMPHWTGLDILEELRKRGQDVPVLILSARSRTPDKVEGLNLGADDYMTKPFDLPELIARIGVMLRRKRLNRKATSLLTFGDVAINKTARTVRVRSREVSLSATEFDLLSLLASSPGRVFSRESILEQVWGWDYEGTTRTVDNFVASLRKKLRSGPHSQEYIQTVPRVGYKVEDHPKKR